LSPIEVSAAGNDAESATVLPEPLEFFVGANESGFKMAFSFAGLLV
jgi:hypothetical protein